MSDPQGDGPNPPNDQTDLSSDVESPTSAGGTAPKRAPVPLADDDGGGDGPNPPNDQP